MTPATINKVSNALITTVITITFSIGCISIGWCFNVANRVVAIEKEQIYFKETLDDIKHYQEESTKEIKLISTTLTRLLTKYESTQTQRGIKNEN